MLVFVNFRNDKENLRLAHGKKETFQMKENLSGLSVQPTGYSGNLLCFYQMNFIERR